MSGLSLSDSILFRVCALASAASRVVLLAVSVIAGSVVKSCLLVASLSATVFARVLIMAARGLHMYPT